MGNIPRCRKMLFVFLGSASPSAFRPPAHAPTRHLRVVPSAQILASEPNAPAPAPAEITLQAKMASWEATEEEQRAATLGGGLPGGMPGAAPRKLQRDATSGSRLSGDAGFDVGMIASGAILLPLALGVLTFPLWIGNIASTLPEVPQSSLQESGVVRKEVASAQRAQMALPPHARMT